MTNHAQKRVEKQNILKKVTKEKISIKEARKEVINQNKKKETNIQEKGKKPKVTKDNLTDFEGVDNLLVFIGLVITNLKKFERVEEKVQYMSELAFTLFNFKTNKEYIKGELNKLINLI